VIGGVTQFLEVYLTAETPHKVADIAPYRPCQLSQQLRGRN
jgi:hypothetical protein